MINKRIAIIGSGPTCIYILKQISDQIYSAIKDISIFEKSNTVGTGMPYNPETTDIYNLSNISSKEIPMMEESFYHWLTQQPEETLQNLNVREFPVSKSKVYSRLTLGSYLKEQFEKLVKKVQNQGIGIHIISECEISDIISDHESNNVTLSAANSKQYSGFDKVIIATGHIWTDHDKP